MTGGNDSCSSPQVEDPLDRRIARRCGWLLIGVMIWMSRLLLPQPPAPPELDPSWQQGLQYALAHGFQFGRDILFTFGPLGGLAHARYQPELYWIQILVFELLFKGLLVWRWITALRRWPGALDRGVFVLMLIASELGNDAFFFSTTVVLASLQLEDPPPARPRLALDFLLLAVIAFIKFTYFMLVGGVVLMVVVRFALRSWRAGLQTLGIYCGAVLLVWSVCGQAPWNLPIWILRAAAIASGYSEAQAYDGPLPEVYLGVVWLALLLAISAGTILGSAQRRERLLAALVVIGGGYVAFKASFTYHSAHGITFFGFAALSLCALRPASDAKPIRRILLGVARAASILICIYGLSMRYRTPEEMVGHTFGEGTQNLLRAEKQLANLPDLRDDLEQLSRRRGLVRDLPRIRSIVGRKEIDLVSSTQAWLFLNGMNWKPRPVFQSYVTVGPSLIALNEEFYSGPKAPEYVLLDMGTIDNRMSGMEDCGTLRALMHGYVPVAVEQGLVLMHRDPDLAMRPPERVEILDSRDIRPNEIVRLAQYPGNALRVRFDIRYTWLGQLRKLLYHAPITGIQMQLSDGYKPRCRLMPDMVRSGVLMRPYMQGSDDWVRLHTRGVFTRVNNFRIVTLSNWDSLYEPTIHMVIERCDDVLPRPKQERELDLAFGSFGTKPVFCSSNAEVRCYQVGRGEVVLVGPTSRIVFELTPGKHHLTGAFGLLKESLDHSDGVVFTVALMTKDGRRALLEQDHQPRTEHELSVPIDLDFEAQDGERLLLLTSNQPDKNPDFDLAYWDGITID